MCDFVLLYPVYAVLFTDTGLSAADVSSLFVVWSLTGFVLEVPSGVWADVVSRRRLLALAPTLAGLGFLLWTVVPSYPAFLVGFVLWGAAGALQSGAVEALVYTELERLDATDAYARLSGRSDAVATTAVTLASALAAPVLAVGGYLALGIASMAVCLLASTVAFALPDSRAGRPAAEPSGGEPYQDGNFASDDQRPPDGGDDGVEHDDDDCGNDDGSPPAAGDDLGYWETLVTGLRQVRHAVPVQRAMLLVVVLAGLTTLDEYLPLLAAATGADGPRVAILMVVVLVGSALGGWFADRDTHRVPAVLAVGAVCLALGAGSGRPEGMLLLAVAYGTFEWATIGADAKLQERVPDQVRATVTSLASLGTEVAVIAVYASYGLGSLWLPPAPIFAVAALGYLAVAVAAAAAGRSSAARPPA